MVKVYVLIVLTSLTAVVPFVFNFPIVAGIVSSTLYHTNENNPVPCRSSSWVGLNSLNPFSKSVAQFEDAMNEF